MMFVDEDADPGKAAFYAELRLKELSELRNILKTYGGRAFLWRLLEQCGIFHVNTACDNSVFMDNGKRLIGGWAWEEMFEADPDAYILMRQEAQERLDKIRKVEEQ